MKRAQSLSIIAMVIAASGLAIGAPEKTKENNKDMLRGPKVVTSTTTQSNDKDNNVEPAMTMQGEHERTPVVMREIVTSIRILSSESAQAKLDLTDEQSEKIKAILQQYREDMRAFQEENREKMREMRDEANKQNRERRAQDAEKDGNEKEAVEERGERGERGERTQRGQREARAESPAAKKLRDFVDNNPASKKALKEIKSVLTPEQFKLVENQAHTMRQRAQQGRRGQDAGEGDQNRRTPARERIQRNPSESPRNIKDKKGPGADD
jgi:Spy/CpxP family protein refolding chaperone